MTAQLRCPNGSSRPMGLSDGLKNEYRIVVAYNFQRQFAEPILAGTKGGTIRAARRWRYGPGLSASIGGHAFPGEELQLYTGMRSKNCALIARKTCVAVEPITVDFHRCRIALGEGSGGMRALIQSEAGLNRFAAFDGFANFAEMSEFWLAVDRFEGWHIRWLPLTETLLQSTVAE
jgi:hypothetical protein